MIKNEIEIELGNSIEQNPVNLNESTTKTKNVAIFDKNVSFSQRIYEVNDKI